MKMHKEPKKKPPEPQQILTHQTNQQSVSLLPMAEKTMPIPTDAQLNAGAGILSFTAFQKSRA